MKDDNKNYERVKIDDKYYYEDKNGRLYDYFDYEELPESQQSVWSNGQSKDNDYDYFDCEQKYDSQEYNNSSTSSSSSDSSEGILKSYFK